MVVGARWQNVMKYRDNETSREAESYLEYNGSSTKVETYFRATFSLPSLFTFFVLQKQHHDELEEKEKKVRRTDTQLESAGCLHSDRIVDVEF